MVAASAMYVAVIIYYNNPNPDRHGSELCWQNYHQFCLMVDQSRHMKVDESMARSPWTTDDFNQVLAAHTEMVSILRGGRNYQHIKAVFIMILPHTL